MSEKTDIKYESLKFGKVVNLTINGMNLKGTIGKKSKTDDLTIIKVPVQWSNAIKDLTTASECIVTCKIGDETFEEHSMILMEKKIESEKSPALLFMHFKKIAERGELRKHERINCFIFTEFNKDNSDEKIIKKPLDGTISNISLSGCLLMSWYSIGLDEDIYLLFKLRDDALKIKIKGRIKNKRKSHLENIYYYGLEFMEINENQKHDIWKEIKSFLNS